MLLDVFAEEGGVGKSETVADLFDAEVGLTQVVADVFEYLFTYPLIGGLTGVLLANGREVFWRYAQFAGVCFYRTVFHLAGVQQVKKSLEVTFSN